MISPWITKWITLLFICYNVKKIMMLKIIFFFIFWFFIVITSLLLVRFAVTITNDCVYIHLTMIRNITALYYNIIPFVYIRSHQNRITGRNWIRYFRSFKTWSRSLTHMMIMHILIPQYYVWKRFPVHYWFIITYSYTHAHLCVCAFVCV